MRVLAVGHYVVSKLYLIFLVLTENPNPFRRGGLKKREFLAGARGHIEYLNI